MSTTMAPDLASVLRTLASFTSGQQPPPPTPAPPTTTLEEGEEEEEEYDPSNFVPTTTLPPAAPTRQRPPSSSYNQPVPPHHHPAAGAPPPSTSSSSSITTWPPALRHVMKALVPNQGATHRIRHLIKTQHEHERQWWAGREALVLKQQGREEGRRRLNDVLASIGGLVNSANHDSSPATELSLYDRKVHRACTAMVSATTAELARLGVPFFNTRSDLLVREKDEEGGGDGMGGEGEGGRNRMGGEAASRDKQQQGLDEEQLRVLQGKMLVLLEDLCSE